MDNFYIERGELTTEKGVKYKGTRFCTYNIRHGGNSRMALALKCMSRMNIDFGILTETKLTRDTYAKHAYGYDLIATEAKSKHQGGVALFFRKSPHYIMEGVRKYGHNVIRAVLVSGNMRWLIIGCYVPSSEKDGKTLDFVQDAARDSHRYDRIIMLGDLNTDLNRMIPYDDRREVRRQETIATIASMGLVSLQKHFVSGNNQKWTWHQKRKGIIIKSTCDYILTSNKHDFTNFQIKTPIYFDSDHRMVIATILLQSEEKQKTYIKMRSKYPISFYNDEATAQDKLLKEIMELKEDDEEIIRKKSNDWISEESHRLFKQKSLARNANDPIRIRQYKRLLQKSLRNDRLHRVNKVAKAAETCLKHDNVRAAYQHIHNWYKDMGEKTTNSTVEDIDKISQEYEQLYQKNICNSQKYLHMSILILMIKYRKS